MDISELLPRKAMAFTKGKRRFVVSTHTDKARIEFNSTNLDCTGKF